MVSSLYFDLDDMIHYENDLGTDDITIIFLYECVKFSLESKVIYIFKFWVKLEVVKIVEAYNGAALNLPLNNQNMT